MKHVFVIGNEKGGAGKTTCAMHLICSMLDRGLSVASIDADIRQLSLTRYLQNRQAYNAQNPGRRVAEPVHFVLTPSILDNVKEQEAQEKQEFEDIINRAKLAGQVVVIDTPGSFSHFARIAHSYADTIITPINDSFIDLDLIAKINPKDFSVVMPSIYSETVWRQKMVKSQREGKSITWILMRNRLASVDSLNKKNMTLALASIAKRFSLKIAPGFSERVIFRELFLQGLTLVDLTKDRRDKSFSISHIAARQELRDFINYIGVGL